MTPLLADNLIAAAAAGYQCQQVEMFILSALQNTSARIALIVQETDRELISWLSGHPRITLFRTKKESDSKQAAVTRFQRFLTIAERTSANRILLTDSRDVFFQADPFQTKTSDPEATQLEFAAEPKLIQNCPVNKNWIHTFFGNRQLSGIHQQPVLCVGTIMGTKESALAFLRQFVAFINDSIRDQGGIQWGLDQAALNVLVHSGQLKQRFCIQNHTSGPFLTLYHQQRFSLDSAGRLLCEDNSIAPVVHQYDRYPWLSTLLQSSLLQQTSRP